MEKPALGIIEYKSVPKGIVSCDRMVKKAPIQILSTHPICPGKYMTIIGGDVADVSEAMEIGINSAREMLVNDLFLPLVHPTVLPAIAGTTAIESFSAVAILETFSVVTCVKAADIAAKTTPVQLIEIRLANGLGGKAFFTMTGELSDLEAALDRAKTYAKNEGMLCDAELIPAPHPQLIEKGIYW